MRYISEAVLKAKTKEISTLCMNEDTLEAIAPRCWRYAVSRNPGPAARRTIDKHLTQSAELKGVIQEDALRGTLSTLEREEDGGKGTKLWKHFLSLLDVMGLGFERTEAHICKDWW
jgi:hypothetical protein